MTIDRLAAGLADRYRIERELGQGGMATVYLAQDLRHDRKVAIKVLHPDLAAALGAQRFLQEIKTTANLQHPHILPLHDSGEVTDGIPAGRGIAFPLLCHAVRRRGVAARPVDAGEAAPDRRSGPDRAGSGQRARLRPPPRRDPSRHQAREHPAARRVGTRGRFRHRPRRPDRRRRTDDADRPLARHAAVHEPRTGDGREADRRPQRHLRPGRRALRNAQRRPAVHRLDGAGDRRQGDDGTADAAPHPARHRAARASKRR